MYLVSFFLESLPKVQYWCSKGQALNVLPDYCQEAEECLSKAIKHDPTLIEAWNGLGETYWKAGKVQEAYDCFVGSLAHVRRTNVGSDYDSRGGELSRLYVRLYISRRKYGSDTWSPISWALYHLSFMCLS